MVSLWVSVKMVVNNKLKINMKKVIAIVFIATVIVACGNSGFGGTEVKTDSTAVAVDTVAVDSVK
jgi:hypothetical protein